MKAMKKIGFIVLLMFLALACKKQKYQHNSRVTPNDFLSSDKYEELVVDLVYVDGYRPSSNTIHNLKILLETRLNKPKGVTIKERGINSPGRTVYGLSDLAEIEKQYRKENTGGKTLTAFLLFLDGRYSEDDKVLGVAYNNSSAVIFSKLIKDNSGGIFEPQTDVLEGTVTKHEIGHLLGLVNSGSPMVNGHEDSSHTHHCTNDECIMYYAAENVDVVGSLIGSSIPEFDQNCINDLRANGGK